MQLIKFSFFLSIVLLLWSCSELTGPYKESKTNYCQSQMLKNQFIVHWKNSKPSLIFENSVQNFMQKNNQEIDFVEPNYAIQAQQISSVLTSRNPQINSIYDMIHVRSAWHAGIYGKGIIVAIVDTGIDMNHKQLRSHLLINKKESASGKNKIDDDQNGFADDIWGWNFILNKPNPVDETGHGTAMAGIVTGPRSTNSSLSLAPDAKILAVDFMDESGGTEFNADAAISYALSRGVKIINNSWSVSCSELLKKSFVNWSHENVIFVNSSGNRAVDVVTDQNVPAALDLPNHLNVGSLDDMGYRSYFSGYGEPVRVYAPGESIPGLYSLASNYQNRLYSGTSISTAIVSAAAALLWSAFPRATALDIISLIEQGANQEPHSSRALDIRRSLILGRERF